MEFSNKDLLKLYGDMWFIRQFEERLADMFAEGVVPGFVHLGVGQEACMAGTCFNLEDGDTIGATHREHGVLLCRGVDPKIVMAEVCGKETGVAKGRGGSMHTADLSKGCLGNGAILGTYQTMINGFAYAHKLKDDKRVSVSMYGDGQSNRGDVFEGMNLAATWNLPTIYILQNNGYAISVPKEKQQKVEDLSIRGPAMGMPSVSVDGQDVLAVAEAMHEAVERARKGEGPTLLVYETYRFRGHFEGDPQTYKTKEEQEEWMTNRDPIKNFHKLLIERGVATEEELEAIKLEKKALVDEAEKFSRESAYPDPAGLMDGVFYYDEGSEQNA